MKNKFIRSFGKFSAVGVFNSVVGYAVIFLLSAFDVSPYLSNLSGYVVGFFCSFFLSKKFVFSAHGNGLQQFVRFLLAFLFSYALNLLVLHQFLIAHFNKYLAQVVAGGIYLVAMYFLSKKMVFK